MTDTPSSILLLRLQSVGSNVNLWGGYLNAAMQTIERASKGYQALAVTGSATIAWTNYSAANDGSVAFLKLTGALSSAVALTFPGYQHFVAVWNATGAAVTIKCSGGTGVVIANGDQVLIYCDATDYYNAAPSIFKGAITVNGQLHGMATGSASTDGVNVAQLAAAIAASVPLGTAGTFLNSVTDTTRGYMTDKLTVTGSGAVIVTPSTTNPSANEKQVYAISIGSLALTLQAEQTAGFTASAGKSWPVNIATTGQILFPASASNGDVIEIDNYGAGTVTFNWNSLKYNGSTTSIATNSKGIALFRYTNATTGWVDL